MKRDVCPICGASGPVQIEHRTGIPVFLNRLEATHADALAAVTGTLDLVGCRHCGIVWNRAFDPNLVPYDANYENDQTHSRAFREHVERMAAKVLSAAGDGEPIDVVEVGCGQGVFLAALAELAGPRLRSAVGFDPAYRAGAAPADPRIRLYAEYFDERALSRLDVPASLVVTRHTLGQVGDPVGVLSAIRRGMAHAGARIFIETPDVAWVIERREIQDLFYEHCSLFNPHTISVALQKAGFAPATVEHVFGGQYMWASASVAERPQPVETNMGSAVPFPSLSEDCIAFVTRWRERLVAAHGPVAVWGAGAKGVMFCTLVDPDARRIASVVDINPGKHAKFIPIAGHPVRSPETLRALGAKTVIVMNPNYASEVRTTLQQLKVDADVLVLGEESV